MVVDLPAFCDIHVHFREPGQTWKETIRTGSLAAARGGYTLVCAMPNLDPVPDSPEHLALEQAAIDRDAVITVLPYCSITKERKGKELTDFHTLKKNCVAFSDDGSGVQGKEIMREAMQEAAREGVILAAHCEDDTLPGADPRSEWGPIERDLELAGETGCRYHVCHISSRESVRLIRQAKAAGIRVTCETAPHYLTLCQKDVLDHGRFKMNPPIRTADDREALIEGLLDGTIDAIATDHAPHSAEEKGKGFTLSANGIVGLETAFPVLYTRLVKTGRITLERLTEALSEAPRRIFGLPLAPQDRVLIDLDTPFVIDSTQFASMGHSTPFDGWKVYGLVLETRKNGITVYKTTYDQTL